MKTYCQKCGAKIEFSVKSKPKFCHGCGTSLGLSPTKATTLTEEEGEGEVVKIPNISELDIEIATHMSQGESLGNIVGTAENHSPNPFDNKTKQLSKKEFREQFQKEAGTLRTSGSPAPPNEE